MNCKQPSEWRRINSLRVRQRREALQRGRGKVLGLFGLEGKES